MDTKTAITLLGLKFYAPKEDEIEVVRIVNVLTKDNSNNEALVECTSDMNGSEKIVLDPDDLVKTYTKLIPDGIMAFAIGRMENAAKSGVWYNDIIVTTYTSQGIYDDKGKGFPAIVCRQLCKDVINITFMKPDKNTEDYIGCCVSKDSVPAETMKELMYVDDIDFMTAVNIYINDTVEEIVDIIGTKAERKINKVLDNIFHNHINSIKGLDIGQDSIKGRCRNLRTLLKVNNYQYMQDVEYHIIPFKFKVTDHIHRVNENNMEYDEFDDEILKILSDIYWKKFTKAITIEYDHDIDMKKMDQKSTILIRDITGKLYLVHVVEAGEYLKKEIEEAYKSDAWNQIAVVNKYGMKSQNRK